MARNFVIPFFAYLLGASLVGSLPNRYYAVGYSVMVIAVSIVTWWYLRPTRAVVPHWRIVPGVVVGLVGIALWIVYLIGLWKGTSRNGYPVGCDQPNASPITL